MSGSESQKPNATGAAEPVVYVVDDEESVRGALRRLLRAVGMRVETFASAREFLEHPLEEGPSCLVLDVRMPGMSGVELQREMARRGIQVPIVFVTAYADVPMSVETMKAGAKDFLQKPFGEQDLLDAIHDALEKDVAASRRRRRRDDVLARVATLTPREREVFALVVTGMLNKQIGAELGTSEKTVKVHRARVMRKLGATSVAELVRMAHVAGVMESPD